MLTLISSLYLYGACMESIEIYRDEENAYFMNIFQIKIAIFISVVESYLKLSNANLFVDTVTLLLVLVLVFQPTIKTHKRLIFASSFFCIQCSQLTDFDHFVTSIRFT